MGVFFLVGKFHVRTFWELGQAAAAAGTGCCGSWDRLLRQLGQPGLYTRLAATARLLTDTGTCHTYCIRHIFPYFYMIPVFRIQFRLDLNSIVGASGFGSRYGNGPQKSCPKNV
jgi:hypothetical protein